MKKGRSIGRKHTIEEAYRYFANAKETLSKSTVEYNRYTDAKYTSEASGTAYLAALIALNAYLVATGTPIKDLPKSIEHYWEMLRKKIPHNGKLAAAMSIVYENLHLFGYYHGGTNVDMIKSGFENCKKIIDMMASSLQKRQGYQNNNGISKVEEPGISYKRRKKSKE